MDSSAGSMLSALDVSSVDATPKSVKHRVSGATGGRSGLKLSRQTDEKTSKSPESKTKKMPLKTSASCKRMRRNVSVETPMGELSPDVDELAKSEQKTDKVSRNTAEDSENQVSVASVQSSSSEKRGTQRITRCNSDLRIADLDSLQCQPVHSDDVSETITPAETD